MRALVLSLFLAATAFVRAETITCGNIAFNLSLATSPASKTKSSTCRIVGGPARTNWTSTVSPTAYSWPPDLNFTITTPNNSGKTSGAGKGRFTVTGTGTATSPQPAGTYTTTFLVPVKFGASTYNGSFDVSITVKWPIDASSTQGLSFGRIVSSGSAGTVTMSAANVRTATGGVSLLPGGGETRGQVSISGAVGNWGVDITYPASTILTNGVQNITLNNFAAAGSPASVTTSNIGTASFFVGGRLNVAANQAGGTYNGNIYITLAYQ